jgi:hypothetical protein
MVAVAAPSQIKTMRQTVTHLRLVTDDGNCNAEARRLDHSLIAHRQPRVSLSIRNISSDGLSAISDQPVHRGEQVGISFPRDGRPTCTAIGRVTKCEPTGNGYRIAVEFDPLPAA